jgi:hypothetical protein
MLSVLKSVPPGKLTRCQRNSSITVSSAARWITKHMEQTHAKFQPTVSFRSSRSFRMSQTVDVWPNVELFRRTTACGSNASLDQDVVVNRFKLRWSAVQVSAIIRKFALTNQGGLGATNWLSRCSSN